MNFPPPSRARRQRTGFAMLSSRSALERRISTAVAGQLAIARPRAKYSPRQGQDCGGDQGSGSLSQSVTSRFRGKGPCRTKARRSNVGRALFAAGPDAIMEAIKRLDRVRQAAWHAGIDAAPGLMAASVGRAKGIITIKGCRGDPGRAAHGLVRDRGGNLPTSSTRSRTSTWTWRHRLRDLTCERRGGCTTARSAMTRLPVDFRLGPRPNAMSRRGGSCSARKRRLLGQAERGPTG